MPAPTIAPIPRNAAPRTVTPNRARRKGRSSTAPYTSANSSRVIASISGQSRFALRARPSLAVDLSEYLSVRVDSCLTAVWSCAFASSIERLEIRPSASACSSEGTPG